MIDVKELIIGNIVTYLHPKEAYAIRVNASHIYEASINQITLNPIHLTPEILVKCGFKMSITHTCYGMITEDGKLRLSVFNDGRFKIHTDDLPINMLYLHQLQNLYFALTQTELKIEL